MEPARTEQPARTSLRVSKPVALAVAVAVLALGFVIGAMVRPRTVTRIKVRTVERALPSPSPSPASAIPVPSPIPAASGPGITDVLRLGRHGTDGSLTFTVASVEVVPEVARIQGGPLRSRAGGKLVAAHMTVRNDGTKSVDIYCAFDMGERLIDVRNRQFDAVDQMYDIAGNTGCNERLEPGFSTTETIVFEVPKDAVPVFVQLWDPNEGSGGSDLGDSFGEESAVTFLVPGAPLDQ